MCVCVCMFLDLIFSLPVEFMIKSSLSEKEVKKGKENWIGRYKEKKIKRRNSSLRKEKERRQGEGGIK